MSWQFTPYAAALLVAGLVMAVLLVLLLPHRRTPGGTAMVGLLGGMLVWTVALALESVVTTVGAKVALSVASYPGVASVPVFFLLFAADYSQQPQVLPTRRWTLWVVPALVVVAAATNPWHGLLWSSFTPAPGNVLVYGHSWFFWLLVAYSYLLIFLGQVLLLMAVGLYPGIYRRQLLTVFGFSFIPLVGNAAYVLGASPLPYLDPAPILFSIAALGLTWGVIRQDLFQLVPVAQHKVMENIEDGVLVSDLGQRVVSVNAAMRTWLGVSEQATGQPISRMLADWPELLAFTRRPSPAQGDLRLARLGYRDFDVRLTPMRNSTGQTTGQILVLRDITQRRQAERESRRANAQLAAQLATIEALQAGLRDQALRDPLTGLYNRRYLDETMGRELERARRDGFPVSLVMLDVDGFKGLNDQFGHDAGDDVLRLLGTMLTTRVRAGDIACRFGGDEFVVLLSGSTRSDARTRAESWRLGFTNRVRIEHPELNATISCGLACFPQDAASPGELMRAADRALYAAKSGGRDRVQAAWPDPSERDSGSRSAAQPRLPSQVPAGSRPMADSRAVVEEPDD